MTSANRSLEIENFNAKTAKTAKEKDRYGEGMRSRRGEPSTLATTPLKKLSPLRSWRPLRGTFPSPTGAPDLGEQLAGDREIEKLSFSNPRS